ncbi:alpha/beta-hydrolase family protein [Mycobacterium sp. CVI_P3]|uniref:Alpha/beta-hydrolase family protein n=1 Tax=Mycobacterium pinniadriaticum TaxID=2994102 RepID=A0ABT3S740_9MYCO|nr:alpha/beta-hydrolase family protein [Mycobacterium pinniadriaticum]MCX2928817.1 alpha/beta-hydrolase family protein [Mycobacterium pinniadriaticum]MCX2935316.1 alpha/beta-hydrolase family protein [Mycobacterium pinniadriaticum]
MTSTVDDATGETLAPPESRRRRESLIEWAWSLVRLDFVGVAFGAFFFCLSLTPSLLPRDWVLAGVIGGINAAIGYGLGVLAGKVFRRLFLERRPWWPPGTKVLYTLKTVTVVLSIGASVVMLVPAAAWQRQIAAVMGIEGPSTLVYLRTLVVALITGGALVGVARVIKDAIKFLARVMIRRWDVNDEVAMFIGTAIVVVLMITLVNGVLYRGFIAGARTVFQPQNDTTRPGISQPVEPERSGSSTSFAPWDTLGFQGRNFVASGPHAAELTELNGRPAKEPIRIYAGLETADTTEGRLAVLLSELQRTKAFDRKVLVIIPTTGTGWVDPVAARSIEAMYNGDTALVAMQYSYLPSWISFLADRQKSVEAGTAMIDAIHQRWSQWPEGSRPKLMLYGESLGSMAGQGAFGYLPDVVNMGFSSVLWVGPPNASTLWKALTVRRDPGTPEIQPWYDAGRTVRFAQAAGPAEIAGVAASPPWKGTRVLYLQHPSDPVVWWTPDLLFERPDWLKEPPGFDRSAAMRWYPIVTFWQVSADMAGNVTSSQASPIGHGHNYGDSQLDGWVAVAAPDGWTPADTERIRLALDNAIAAGGPEFQ